jgi:hypothetical protein
MPRPSLFDELVRNQTAHTLSESVRIAIEQSAAEIAKEMLADEDFRRALKASIKRLADQLLADLGRPQPERRRTEQEDR